MVCIKGVSQWRRIAAILNHLSILILKNVLSEDVTEVAGLRKNYFIFKKILTEIKKYPIIVFSFRELSRRKI